MEAKEIIEADERLGPQNEQPRKFTFQVSPKIHLTYRFKNRLYPTYPMLHEKKALILKTVYDKCFRRICMTNTTIFTEPNKNKL